VKNSKLAVAAAAFFALALTGCGGGTAPSAGASTAQEAEKLKRIEIIAPAAPGSGWDQTARAVQDALQREKLATSAEVKNVPGASGTVALAQIAPQTGKKDTLVASGLAMMSGVLTNGTPVTLDNLTPIARLIGDYEMIVVPAGSAYTSLDELFAAIKADPKSVAIAGGSAGSADHIFISLVAQKYGIDPSKVNYVPFSGGGEATTALLGQKVQAGVAGVGEFAAQVKAGKLKGLAVSSKQKLDGVDVASISDAGHEDLEFANWRSIMAPGGISDAEKKAYIAALTAMSTSPAWKEALVKNSWADFFMAGDDFDSWLDEENSRVQGALKSLGLAK
jgi:putative tricarboxylic transport membrane protein